MRLIVIITAIGIILLCGSCESFNKLFPFDDGPYQTYDYKFHKYEPYLSIDSVYKDVGVQKFNQLKSHFLSVWLHPYLYDSNAIFKLTTKPYPYGSSNMKHYVDPDICYFKDGKYSTGFRGYSLLKVYVENILHTKKFDTLLVMLITHEAILDSNGNIQMDEKKQTKERLCGNFIRVLVNDSNNWEFVCAPIKYSISDYNNYSEKMLFEFRKSLKRQIIRCSYFKKDLTPDPTFWYRLFTSPDIFFPDPYKDGFPLH